MSSRRVGAGTISTMRGCRIRSEMGILVCHPRAESNSVPAAAHGRMELPIHRLHPALAQWSLDAIRPDERPRRKGILRVVANGPFRWHGASYNNVSACHLRKVRNYSGLSPESVHASRGRVVCRCPRIAAPLPHHPYPRITTLRPAINLLVALMIPSSVDCPVP